MEDHTHSPVTATLDTPAAKDAPVGFRAIRLRFDFDTDATPEQVEESVRINSDARLRALLAEQNQQGGVVSDSSSTLKGLARLLRRNPTDAERILWQALTRDRRFAGQFKRLAQHRQTLGNAAAPRHRSPR